MTIAPGGSGVSVTVDVGGNVGEGRSVLVELLVGLAVGDVVFEGTGFVMLASGAES